MMRLVTWPLRSAITVAAVAMFFALAGCVAADEVLATLERS